MSGPSDEELGNQASLLHFFRPSPSQAASFIQEETDPFLKYPRVQPFDCVEIKVRYIDIEGKIPLYIREKDFSPIYRGKIPDIAVIYSIWGFIYSFLTSY